jgi:hypothetical protein
MYNTSFKCTYNLINDQEDECDYLREALYRSQLLQAFNMNDLEQESKFENVFNYINEHLIKSEKGKTILENMRGKNPFPIGDMELVLLFSYDYFYLFHNCLIDLFMNGYIEDENYNMLIQKIENN